MAGPNSKSVYIQYGSEVKIKISFAATKSKEHTCDWLLKEAIRQLKQTYPLEKSFDSTVVLQTVNGEFAVDHWLTMAQKSLSVLKDGTILKPFFRQEIPSQDESSKVSLDSFIIETKLGYGAFSDVYLARKKDTGALYALKQIKKGDMSRRKKKIVMRERQAMLDINSPHVVALRYAFQTKNYFYLVMDFVPCGDLHSILNKRKLKESEVLFYVAEGILALNSIHGQNYVYRDLKPENLLLDLDGHIHLTDFGLAKKVGNLGELNYSQCGTLQVMAPEIIKETGYNCSVDYYNIGTLTYELATGKIPVFTEKDRLFLEENNPSFDKLSDELKDFILRLLEPKPPKRLGAMAGLKEISAHPWMSSLNLYKLHQKKIKPPLLFDPSSIKFKAKTSVPERIDAIDALYLSNELTNLPDFSFYGLAEESLLIKLELKESNSCEKSSKGLISSSVSTNDSPVSRFRSIGDSMTSCEENAPESSEMQIGCESIASKCESYKLPNVKSMKILQTNSLNMRKFEIN